MGKNLLKKFHKIIFLLSFRFHSGYQKLRVFIRQLAKLIEFNHIELGSIGCFTAKEKGYREVKKKFPFILI